MVFYCIDSSEYILYSEIKIRSTFGIYRPYFSYQLGTNNNSLCFMSQVLASGIDMGNLVTLSAVFQTNESDPMKSVPVKVADRNGMKEPS